jgi:hypothetical protein
MEQSRFRKISDQKSASHEVAVDRDANASAWIDPSQNKAWSLRSRILLLKLECRCLRLLYGVLALLFPNT